MFVYVRVRPLSKFNDKLFETHANVDLNLSWILHVDVRFFVKRYPDT